MSGVISSSDVFAQQKLASGSVHGRTLPDRLFAKALERQKRHGCRWFQAEASLLLQTCSPKMNKDVYFWACLRVFFARTLYIQNVQGWTGCNAETSSHCELVAHECTRMYIRGRGCPWFKTEAMFLRCKNSRPEVYTDVHFRTGYFQKRWKGRSGKVVYIW